MMKERTPWERETEVSFLKIGRFEKQMEQFCDIRIRLSGINDRSLISNSFAIY